MTKQILKLRLGATKTLHFDFYIFKFIIILIFKF